MKRLFFALAAAWVLTLGCLAQPPVEELYERFGVTALERQLPEQTLEMTKEIFSDGFSITELLSLTPGELFSAVGQQAKRAVTQYRGELLSVMTAVLLSAVLAAVGESGSQSDVFGLICALSVTAVLLRPVLGCMRQSCDTIRELSRFMLAYIPVYVSVMTASGSPAGAAAYQTAVLAASQVMNQLSSTVFMPLMQGYMLLSLSGAAGGNKGTASLCAGVKRLTNWGLALTATVFTGILSLQSIVGSAADSAFSKTAKLLAGSFVPVIGGAFSDALSAMQGSLRVIKAAVGGFGVAAAALGFMPVLINITVLRIVIWFAKTAAETLSAGQARGVLSGFADVLASITALLLCAVMLLVISTAIMMTAASAAVM